MVPGLPAVAEQLAVITKLTTDRLLHGSLDETAGSAAPPPAGGAAATG